MKESILIKLSGEALKNDKQEIYDEQFVISIAKQIRDLVNDGYKISLVIGGGNIYRGRSASSNSDRCKSDSIGMLATIQNGIYFTDVLHNLGIKSVVMTPFICHTFTENYNKDKALEYLNNNIVTIFAGGVGHPFFSTDTICALRASELCVDKLLFAKNIDGIYDKDPNKYDDAVKYDKISYTDVIKNELEAIDLEAMIMLKKNNIKSIIFNLKDENSIVNIVNNTSLSYTEVN